MVGEDGKGRGGEGKGVRGGESAMAGVGQALAKSEVLRVGHRGRLCVGHKMPQDCPLPSLSSLPGT